MSGFTPQAVWEAIKRARLVRVLVVYCGASFVALQAVALFQDKLGLPDWFFPGAVGLLIVGLPIVIATALVQAAHERHLEQAAHLRRPHPEEAHPQEAHPAAPEEARAPATEGNVGPGGSSGEAGRAPDASAGETSAGAPTERTAVHAPPVPKKAHHLFTWKRAMLGGGIAFVGLGLVVGGWMLTRNLGIGPAGSLVAKGVLDERDPVILAQFGNHTADSLLGPALTEAFRVDLAQSPLITLVPSDNLAEALQQMELPAGTPLDAKLAREVAQRQGVKAVIAGDVNEAGSGYMLSAQLLGASDGRVLAAFRESAGDSTAIISAIDQLSRDLREKIGEGLRSIRASEPLAHVTTGSLDALRKYSQALRVLDVEGSEEQAISLLQEAVSLDSSFAMAWRKLGVVYSNGSRDPSAAVAALQQAYDHRDRLTDRERYLTLGTYYSLVTGEDEKAIAAYQTLLGTYPNDGWALHNLALLYTDAGNYEQAQPMFERALAHDSLNPVTFQMLSDVQVARGNIEGALETQRSFERRLPGHPVAQLDAAYLYGLTGKLDSAETRLYALQEGQAGSAYWRRTTGRLLGDLGVLRGRPGEADRNFARAEQADEMAEAPGAVLFDRLLRAVTDARIGAGPEAARRRIQDALKATPLESLPSRNRSYLLLVSAYLEAGQTEAARRTLAAFDSAADPGERRLLAPLRDRAAGAISLAEGRPEKAIPLLHRSDAAASRTNSCGGCALPVLGRAFEAAGQPDSALAAYQRYVSEPWMWRLSWDGYDLPEVLRRMGVLYAKRGEPAKARAAYGRLLELWDGAEPSLAPRVAAIREAMAALPAGGTAAPASGP